MYHPFFMGAEAAVLRMAKAEMHRTTAKFGRPSLEPVFNEVFSCHGILHLKMQTLVSARGDNLLNAGEDPAQPGIPVISYHEFQRIAFL